MFEKFAKFVGVQGVIALALVGAVIALALAGRPVPDVLTSLATAAAGFYFGSKGGTLTAGFVAWAYWAIPEWRNQRRQLEYALYLLSVVKDWLPADAYPETCKDIEKLFLEVYL